MVSFSASYMIGKGLETSVQHTKWVPADLGSSGEPVGHGILAWGPRIPERTPAHLNPPCVFHGCLSEKSPCVHGQLAH